MVDVVAGPVCAPPCPWLELLMLLLLLLLLLGGECQHLRGPSRSAARASQGAEHRLCNSMRYMYSLGPQHSTTLPSAGATGGSVLVLLFGSSAATVSVPTPPELLAPETSAEAAVAAAAVVVAEAPPINGAVSSDSASNPSPNGGIVEGCCAVGSTVSPQWPGLYTPSGAPSVGWSASGDSGFKWAKGKVEGKAHPTTHVSCGHSAHGASSGRVAVVLAAAAASLLGAPPLAAGGADGDDDDDDDEPGPATLFPPPPPPSRVGPAKKPAP